MIPSPPVSIPPQEFYDGNRGDIFTQKRILMRSSHTQHGPVLGGQVNWIMNIKNAKLIFKKNVYLWAEKLGVKVHALTIREMTTKWASCSTAGSLTFDTRLLNLSPDLQNYVIVHELLHLNVPNHGRLWKSLMRIHLGNYEKCEEKLQDLAKKKEFHLKEAAEKYGSDLFPSPFLKRVISRGGIFRQPRLETYIYVLR
jgi:hypothetical protein